MTYTVNGNNVLVAEQEFQLAKNGDRFPIADSEYFNYYWDDSRDLADDPFDSRSLYDYRTATVKEFWDAFWGDAVEFEGDYGSCYNLATEYEYINAYKLDDMSLQDFRTFIENNGRPFLVKNPYDDQAVYIIEQG